jgi:molybdenum cofactor cytidylyltransferase
VAEPEKPGVTGSLIDRLGLGRRELVAFTGAGGKSTLMLALADEIAGNGRRVLVTTTTKMGRDQLTNVPAVCQNDDLDAVVTALTRHRFVALITGGDDHKATGPPPDVVDGLFRTAPVDHLLVEADGAHGRSLKAPGSHEPVIPSAATTVVVLLGVDAVGGRIADVAHRPEQAALLTGLGVNDRLTVEHCVAVLTHPEGGLKGVPPAARVVVALTKAGEAGGDRIAARIGQGLGSCERISLVAVV